MKNLIAAVLAMCLLFSLTACTEKDADTGSGSSTGSAVSDAGSIGDVGTADNGKDIEITIPASLIGDTGVELSEDEKEQGFKSVKKNEDGSATYTIDKASYADFISTYNSETKKTIEELSSSGLYTYIKSVSVNDDISKVDIKVDRAGFESGMGSIPLLTVGVSGLFDGAFDVNAAGKATINVIDEVTGEIFDTVTYPDDMSK